MVTDSASDSLRGHSTSVEVTQSSASTCTGSSQLGVAEIWTALRTRWSRGEPARAEEYLTREFLAQSDSDEAVDVIYAEYVLAEQYGARPEIDDYVRRFPEYASALRQQIQFHDAFQGEISPTATAPSPESGRHAAEVAAAYPRQFGRYLLVAPLDVGGQSCVFRAIHPDLGQEIVLKTARTAVDRRDVHHDDWLFTEARLLAALSHPNLARIFDAGVVDGQAYLALEYVRGQTLAQVRGVEVVPSPAETASIVAKVARAVAEVHKCGILHLDIKPKNIVLDERKEPRLLDFGLSRLKNAWTENPAHQQGVSGTLEFMAPEQACGETALIGPATDVFALGGILYYLLTGRPLYSGGSIAAVLKLAQNCNWNREVLSALPVPNVLQQICERALAPLPMQRFASAEDLAIALEHSAAQKPVSRAKRIGAAIVLCLLTGAAVVSLRQSGLISALVVESTPMELEIRVWQDDRFAGLSQAVPLRNGDELQVTATIPPGMSAAIMLVTSENHVRQLRAFPVAANSRKIRYPDDTLVPLIGAPGTECLLVLASSEPLPTAAEIESFFRTTTDWPGLPDYSVLRLTPDEIVTEQAGRDFGPPSDRPRPEEVIRVKLDSLRRFLQTRCEAFEAIAFAHSM